MVIGGGLFACAAPILAAAGQLAMLDQLSAGTWELRDRSGKPAQRLCLRSGRDLIQLRHPGPACATYVIDDRANEVEVQYTCRGHGNGRTHIRRETNRLVQLEGNGIADGLPFEFAFEARRISDC
jgi:hypothetical protein